MLIERNELAYMGFMDDVCELVGLVAKDLRANGENVVHLMRNGSVVSVGPTRVVLVDGAIRTVNAHDIRHVHVTRERLLFVLADGTAVELAHAEEE